jgi:hypothetical protein
VTIVTLPTLKLEEVPKPWRGAAGFGAFVGMIGLVSLGFVGFVRSTARAEAEIATRQVLAQDLASFKVEAREAAERAAREGAEKAIREVVAPIALEIAKHRSEDDERVAELKRRVNQIEGRVR